MAKQPISKSQKERKEAIMRIIIILLSGIIFYVWSWIVILLAVVNIIITIITGKKEEALADFCKIWADEFHKYVNYVVSSSDKRPFPFNPMEK